jgi:CubicO group peptidase (beta-lactamase class C family)
MLAMGDCMNFPKQNRRQFLASVAVGGISPLRRQDSGSLVRGVSGSEGQRILKLGNDFRAKYGLPGVSVAMSYRGKLKLLACFGLADKGTNAAVRPHHSFRIASVSKPITSVTILRLMEQAKLSLDDKVFGPNGHLSNVSLRTVSNAKQKRRIQAITIRNLLEHRVGGWTNKRGEAPMFAAPALGMSHRDLIRWTLTNQPLTGDPGNSYGYSNFGYCLLGRVIESATGQTYEKAVKSLVLNRTGSKSLFVGGHKRDQRRTNEVVYYDKYDPYGKNMDVTRMDSHGGWIATPTDLVRFAQCVDGFDTPNDILKPATVATMTTPSAGRYALGWNTNRSNNWWHTGSFNGGSSILARIHDGHCWAVVVNTRSYASGYNAALDKFPWSIKAAIRKWGDHDLFS